MYSVVLMAALATSTTTPAWHHHCGGYCGGYGCYGCGGCYGCHGCYGGYYGGGCYGGGCFAGYAGYGYGWGCYGCYGGSTGWGCSGWGGCYGGFGCWGGYGYGAGCTAFACAGCYGAYGGYSGYGIPVPATTALPDSNYVPPMVNPGPGPAPTTTPPPQKVPETAPPPNKTTRARVRIEVPADAKLFIDDQPMRTGSANRVFQTPPLDEGKVYFYDVRVEIERNGQKLTDAQRLILRSGQEVTASFTNLEQRATAVAARQ